MTTIQATIAQLGIPYLENEPMSRHTTFRIGGPAEVIALPGHTQGSIGIDCKEDCVIVGDALMNMFYPTVSMLYGNEKMMRQSAEKIKEMGDKTIYSVDPKATSPSSRKLINAVFPFSRQGLILAKRVSPFENFIPPLKGLVSQPVGNVPDVGRRAISIHLAG